jgi:hypothetical protein
LREKKKYVRQEIKKRAPLKVAKVEIRRTFEALRSH